MSKTPPPPRKTLDFFSGVTQRLLALEEALKKGLVPKKSELEARSGRIIQNAKRTFGYDKDDLAGSWIRDIERELSNPCEVFVLSERAYKANIVLYWAVSEKMELSFWNGAEKGSCSVFSSQSKSPDQEFEDYWAGLETSFQETLSGLKDSKSAPLFNETTADKAASMLRGYCRAQFLRGYSQGKGEAIWSPEKFRQAVASLIPDRTQG
jgi:hypothetical protein